MRLNYYRFPETAEEHTLLENGCAVILKDGTEVYVDNIPENRRPFVDHIDHCLEGISVTRAKQLLKEYGGSAWTEHLERDGGCFEISEITLTGNNSHFTYNRHL